MSAHRVLFFGDDVVFGAGDPAGPGLVGRLAAAAHAAGTPIMAFNLGVPEQSSVEVSRRWRKEAAPRVPVGVPWSSVFCMGAVDVAAEPGIEPQLSIQALQKVIVRATGIGRTPLVIGPPPLGDARRRERTMRLSARLETIARHYDAVYVETAVPLAATPAWIEQDDALDPGAYDLLADLVAPSFLAWLTRASIAVPVAG